MVDQDADSPIKRGKTGLDEQHAMSRASVNINPKDFMAIRLDELDDESNSEFDHSDCSSLDSHSPKNSDKNDSDLSDEVNVQESLAKNRAKKKSLFFNRDEKIAKYEEKEEDENKEEKTADLKYNEKIVKDDKETKDQTKDIMSKFKAKLV